MTEIVRKTLARFKGAVPHLPNAAARPLMTKKEVFQVGGTLAVLAMALEGCAPASAAPMEAKPIDLSKINPDLKSAVETRSGSKIVNGYTLEANQSSDGSFEVDSNQNNAKKISFDLFGTENGKTYSSFKASPELKKTLDKEKISYEVAPDGSINVVGEVKSKILVYDDGTVISTYSIVGDNKGNSELTFMFLNYGKIEVQDVSLVKQPALEKLVQEQLAQKNVGRFIIGNPFQTSPNAISWLKKSNGDGKSTLVDLVGKVLSLDANVAHAQGLPTGTPPVISITETAPPPTVEPTAIPSTATESAPVLQLDKPMITEFNPYVVDVMPSINEEQNHDVSSGKLANTVDAFWKAHPELGVYDANGNVILPPGVQPIKPEQWQLTITNISQFNGFIFADWENVGGNHTDFIKSGNNSDNSPVRRSNEQFKVVDSSGNASRFLTSNRLYYYDTQGILHVTPVFSAFDIDRNDTSGTSNESKIQISKINGSTRVGLYIPKFNLGRQEGSNPDFSWSENFVDFNKFMAEPMQAKRNEMIQAIKNGTFNPADFGKVWVLVW